MDLCIHGSMDLWIHGSGIHAWTHGSMDPRIHGSMDPWIHGSMDPGSPDPCSITLYTVTWKSMILQRLRPSSPPAVKYLNRDCALRPNRAGYVCFVISRSASLRQIRRPPQGSTRDLFLLPCLGRLVNCPSALQGLFQETCQGPRFFTASPFPHAPQRSVKPSCYV